MNAYDLSAGVFIRGLANLKAQLTKAEGHVAAHGGDEAAVLAARLAAAEIAPVGGFAPADLHAYPLAAHVHWAAEGARLAIDYLAGAHPVPDANVAGSFAELYERIDATIAHCRAVDPEALEAGLERSVVIERPRGSVQGGSRFLVAFAIPHFFYHVTTAYGILRNQGVPLTMGDFVGDWGREPGDGSSG